MKKSKLCVISVILLNLFSLNNSLTYAYDALNTTLSTAESRSEYNIVRTLIALNGNIHEELSAVNNDLNYIETYENQNILTFDLLNLPIKNYNTYSGIVGDYWTYKIVSCDTVLNSEAKNRITEVVYNTTNSYITSNSTVKYAFNTIFDLELTELERDEILLNLPETWKVNAKIDNNLELYLSPNSYGWVDFAPFCYKVVGVISFYNWHGELKDIKKVSTLVPKNNNGLLEGVYYFMESNNSP